jgi:hypothetical protein
VAEDAQGASLAEPVPGLAVDGERRSGLLDGLAGPATGQLDLGQGGTRVTFQHPVAGLAGQPQRLGRGFDRQVQPVEVQVGGGQADHGVDLLAAGPGLVGQPPCLLVPFQGGAIAAQALLGVAEGVQGPGFEELAADLAGELEGLAGQLERLVVAAGVGVDAGQVAQRVGLAAPVANLPGAPGRAGRGSG